jgi:hypothetical protein
MVLRFRLLGLLILPDGYTAFSYANDNTIG